MRPNKTKLHFLTEKKNKSEGKKKLIQSVLWLHKYLIDWFLRTIRGGILSYVQFQGLKFIKVYFFLHCNRVQHYWMPFWQKGKTPKKSDLNSVAEKRGFVGSTHVNDAFVVKNVKIYPTIKKRNVATANLRSNSALAKWKRTIYWNILFLQTIEMVLRPHYAFHH